MIICKDCGHENDADDQFCGSCGSFLEWAGAKVEETAPVPIEYATVADDPTLIQRVRRVIGVDDESLDEHRTGIRERDAADHAADQALADQVVAEREATAEAERRRLAEAAATQSAQEARQAQLEAEVAVAKAEDEAERLRSAAAAAEQSRLATEAEVRVRAEREAQAAGEAAEAGARAAIEATRARVEQAAEDARARAEAEATEATRVAAEAKEREVQAEKERHEADRRLADAAAVAAAAVLRAGQESDAIAAADAARVAAEAEGVRARSEAEAAMALAREEAAKARAELAEAKAEASRLRSAAEGRSADEEIERARRDATSRADEEAAAARRRADADAAIATQRAEADANAAAVRAKAEVDATAREAEAEASRLRAEAAAAKARASVETSRQEAEAEAAKRAREEALRRASALVAKPTARAMTSPASPTTTGTRPGTKPATGKAGREAKSSEAAPDAGAPPRPVADSPAPTQPGVKVPGTEKARPAPKRTTSRELNTGDLVCGQCGMGNPPTRKFCKRCGTSLAEAAAVKLGFFARLRRRFARKPKTFEAGQRRRKASGEPSSGGGGLRTRIRVAFFRLNRHILKIGALLGLVAVLGFGVEPIRQKLQLPNFRQTILNKIRTFSKPVYDSVRPEAASAGPSAPEHDASLAIDLGANTYWAAAPAANGGVGSKLTVTFAKPFDLGRILVHSGAQGDETPGSGFVNQPRPSELRFTLNGDTQNTKTVAVKDTADTQTLTVKGKQTKTVTIEVTGIYPAVDGKGRSVAITEMEFFQRRKIGDDFETLAAPKVEVTSAPEGAGLLTDDDIDTAWTSAPADDGVGQGFTVTFAEPVDLDRIRIAPGHAKKDFTVSPRPDDVQFVITCARGCEPTKQVSFGDKAGFKNIAVTARGVTQIQVQVRSVHGTGGGVAFAELQFQRKRPKVS